MLTLPITERAKTEEWKTIITTATKNGYPKHIIYNLRDKMKHKKTTGIHTKANNRA